MKEDWKVFTGGLMMHGTRMPPSEGKHLNSRDGAVDACAQSGPSLISFCEAYSRFKRDEAYQVNELKAPMLLSELS